MHERWRPKDHEKSTEKDKMEPEPPQLEGHGEHKLMKRG
jgi:hypothetical protein